MHDLGAIGRGWQARIGDGVKAAEHLVAWPWSWKSRASRTTSAGLTPESYTRPCPNTPETHPFGLYVVCIAELCERFAGCLLLSLLVLYLTEHIGLPPARALRWVGTLNAAGYIAALGGGWLVGGRVTAFRGAMLGAILLALGFVVLAVESAQSRLPAFALLTLGSGLFRPAIVFLLSQLYAPQDPRRDAGHTWLWTAVNVGAALAPLAAGFLKAAAGWKAAFIASAFSMLTCLLVLVVGRRHLRIRCLDNLQDTLQTEIPEQHPKGQLRVLGAASVAAILYAAAYGQTDGALLLWARDRTDRIVGGHEIPVAWFSSLPALLLLLIGPALLALMKTLRRRGHVPSPLAKMTLGLTIVGVGYAAMAICASTDTGDGDSPLWLLLCSITLVLGELLIAPIGLALMTRLFAARYGGLGSGFWFALTAMGAWMGGELGAGGQGWPSVWFFAGMAGMLSIGAALIGGVGRLGGSAAKELNRH